MGTGSIANDEDEGTALAVGIVIDRWVRLVPENRGTSRRGKRGLLLNVRGQTRAQNAVIEGRSA